MNESPNPAGVGTAPAAPLPAGDGADAAPPPAAVVVARRKGVSWAWLAPLGALVLAGVLVYQAATGAGRTIRVRFQQGQGIQQNDPVMYRGVRIGTVRSVTLADDLRGVVVTAELGPDSGGVAVEGSRFWIVRPEVSLRGVSGLETLLGPRYMEVQPGPRPDAGAKAVHEFVGLERSPIEARAGWRGLGSAGGPEADGLGLVLEAARVVSSVGSPVVYRGMRVGSVVSVDLGRSGRAVEVGVVIQPEHAHLVRSNTRFWSAGGIGVDFGLVGGLSVKADSLEAVLSGGIEFATPNRAGEQVSSGARFRLESEGEKDWLQWTPDLSP